MTVTVVEAGVGVLAFVGAHYAHEGVHVGAALPWARGGRIDLWRGEVDLLIPEGLGERVRIWISMAPLFVGLAVLALLHLGIGLPALSDETAMLYASWAWFTSPSLTDLRQAAGSDFEQRREWSHADRKAFYLVVLSGWVIIALAGWRLLAPWVPLDANQLWGVALGSWFGVFGGLVLFVRSQRSQPG